MSILTQEKGAEVQSVNSMHLYEVGYDGQAVIELSGKSFDPEAYSRFKYGDAAVADEYAQQIAHELIEERNGDLREAYVASSAYKQVPTAAFFITQRLLSHLGLMNHAPKGVFRIDRGVVFDHDYAALPEEERVEAMQNNGLEINQAALKELKGRDILVIDDIKVTGSHERSLRRELGSVGLNDLLFGYVVAVKPEVAKTFPEVEDKLNGAVVNSLQDIVPIIKKGEFYLNARTCKFLLKQSPGEIENFIMQIPLSVSTAMLSAIISDGYHNMQKFSLQFDTIQYAIAQKRLLEEASKYLEKSVQPAFMAGR